MNRRLGRHLDRVCDAARRALATRHAFIVFDEHDGGVFGLVSADADLAAHCSGWAPRRPEHGVEPGSEHPPGAGRGTGLDRFGIRFYAEFMIPTRSDAGTAWLCLLDGPPRRVTAEQEQLIDDMIRIAADHVESHEDLRAAAAGEAAYRLLVDNSTDTIVRGRLDGVRSYVSPAVQTLLGYEAHELVGRKAADLVHPDDLGSFKDVMAGFGSGSTAHAVVEMRQRHKDGHYVWMEASIKLTHDPLTGSPDGYVTSVRDVSRRKMAEDRLSHLAGHDALTGLPNRPTFETRLAERLERFQRSREGFALLCVDLDGFKSVNDRLGHPAGDDVLRTVSDRFRAIVGEGDTVARLGGDEFAILRVGGGEQPADGLDLAARLVAATAALISIGGERVQVGLSVGIAIPSTERASSDALFAAADHALMQVKRSGKNGCLVAAQLPAHGPSGEGPDRPAQPRRRAETTVGPDARSPAVSADA